MDEALETAVAAALEALDRGGPDGLSRFLAALGPRAADVRRIVARVEALGVGAASVGVALPERLGGYRILRELGRGGMGVVYEVADEALDRRLALKVVRPDQLAAPGARERFAREVAAVASLSHPAIVPILGAGEEAGLPFCVMPLLPGTSAAVAIDRLAGRDPAGLTGADLRSALGAPAVAADPEGIFAGAFWQAAVRLVRQVALGIAHAHEQGIVHRDLKPSNLMLLPDGRALVVDFGLAQLRGALRLTRTGQEPGSPAYMAPEQLRGQAADERTDVYGLGVSLWHLATLAPPFPEQDPIELQQRILAGRPVPPPRGSVSPALLRVLQQAIDRDRDNRYDTAAAFAADLGALLDGNPLAAVGLPRLVRLRRCAERHRALTGALLVAVLACALVPLLLWQQERASLATVLAQKERADRSLVHALGAVKVFLMRTFGAEGRITPQDARVRVGFLEEAIHHLDALGADGAGIALGDVRRDADPRGYLATAHRLLAENLLVLGRTADAERHVRLAIAGYGEGPIGPNFTIGRAVARELLYDICEQGSDLTALGRLVDAIDADLAGAAGADPIPGFRTYLASRIARCRLCRATIQQRSGDEAGRRESCRLAVEGLQAITPEPDAIQDYVLVLSNAFCDLGDALAAAREFAAAADAFQGVHDLYEGHPELARTTTGQSRRAHACSGLAHLAIRQGDHAAARAPLEASWRLHADIRAEDPEWRENSATMTRRGFELGQLLEALGDRSAALPVLRTVLVQLDEFAESRTAGEELLSVRKRTLDLLGHWALAAEDWQGAIDHARQLGALGDGVRNCTVAAGLLVAVVAGAAGRVDAGACRREAVALLLEAERRGGLATMDLDADFGALAQEPGFAELHTRWRGARVPR